MREITINGDGFAVSEDLGYYTSPGCYGVRVEDGRVAVALSKDGPWEWAEDTGIPGLADRLARNKGVDFTSEE